MKARIACGMLFFGLVGGVSVNEAKEQIVYNAVYNEDGEVVFVKHAVKFVIDGNNVTLFRMSQYETGLACWNLTVKPSTTASHCYSVSKRLE